MGNVVENIRSIRIERGVTQEQIAFELNLDPAVVTSIFKGKRQLRLNELEIIANLLEVAVIDLFTWPKRYVDPETIPGDNEDKVSITFEVSKTKRDYLLHLVMGDDKK